MGGGILENMASPPSAPAAPILLLLDCVPVLVRSLGGLLSWAMFGSSNLVGSAREGQ